MLHLKSGDSISAVMGGTAAVINPTVLIRRTDPLTVVVPLNGTTAVTLISGSGTTEVFVESIYVANVDTQANTVTLSATIGGVTANWAVITMQAGDSFTVHGDGTITGINSSGQSLTQYTLAQKALVALGAAADAINPHTSATYVVTKAGVDAMTLAAPTATTDDGIIIVITSSTANAHTLTATGLLQTGAAAVNLATFANQKGASLTLMAYQAKWQVISSTGITFS